MQPSREARAQVDAYLDFRAGLRDVLATGDPKALRVFLRDIGEDLGDSDLRAMGRWTDEAILPLMHRMIIADAKLADHHSASRAWLREHNLPFRVSSTGYGWSTELRGRYRSAKRNMPEARTA